MVRDIAAHARGRVAHDSHRRKAPRGSLTCLVAEALGGTLEQSLPAALAVEMVQAASLVHDDFVDGDTVRRGRPAAWTLLSSRRAVLVADVMFATAIEKMAQAGAREGATLAHAIAAMAQGALQEGAGNTRVEDLDAYRRIIYLKTGSLFAAAAWLGALAVDAQEPLLQAATEFGARAGEPLPDRRRPGRWRAARLAETANADRYSPRAGTRALAAFPDNERTPNARRHALGAIGAQRRSRSRTQ